MYGNFVKESTNTAGNVLTLTLIETLGWARLSAVSSIAIGETFEYTIENGDNKEVGIGTKQAGNTFDRTTPIATLDAGVYDDASPARLTLVGDSEVFVTLSAENTFDKNAAEFNKFLKKFTATLNGTAITNHINLGGSASATGTVGQAYDYCTVSGGNNNTASHQFSTVGGGQSNTASGDTATVVGGNNNTASGNSSTATGGVSNNATGNFSTVTGGLNNISGGSQATAGGGGNITAANYAFSICGRGNKANHSHSSASGGGSFTRDNFDHVFGGTDTATASVSNNTIRLQGAGGNIKIDGAVSSPEADVAECIEWADGNPLNEDRNGFLVSVFQGKLILGGSNPTGIISASPSVISNAAPNGWTGTYLKDKHKRNIKTKYTLIKWFDEWGDEQHVYESQDKTLYDEYPQPTAVNGIVSNKTPIGNLKKETIFTKTINPLFDITLVEDYKPRNERKEWGVVGVLGQITGNTSEVITGWKADADPDNLGSFKNGTTYDVMEHIDDSTILVLYK